MANGSRDAFTPDTTGGDIRNALQAVTSFTEGLMTAEEMIGTCQLRLTSALWKVERLKALAGEQSPEVTARRCLEIL